MTISIEEFYQNNQIDNKFDEVFYSEQYPETKDFYQPHCKANGIDDKHRLYFHCMMYGPKEYKKAETNARKSQQESLNRTVDKWQAICNNTKIIFEKTDNPKVTIVIPSYNKPYYTLACLESLCKTDMIKDCEVIVVNDCSTDNTIKVLQEYVEGIVVINNETNRGFVQSCNVGANLSNSPYIMFLNNDTIVLKRTVSELYNIIHKKDNVGAVGGMIIMSNGLLQEAGCIVLKEGGCFGYGRNDDPFKAEYNYCREVDFCSGALLMTKNCLWKEVKGFDTIYSPGYCEEVDYCLTLKSMGYKIIYQPLSKIYHFESSTFANESLKLQQVNQKKFFNKWQKLLQTFPSTKDDIYRIRSTNTNKRLLYIDDMVPDPKKGQGYPRSYDILKYIASLGFQITVYTTCQDTDTDEHLLSELQQLSIEIIRNNLDFKEFITSRRNLYDIAFISRPHNAEKYLAYIKSNNNAKIIYDAEAIYANRELLQEEIIEGAKLSDEVKYKRRAKELAITKSADVICVVSDYEKSFFDQYNIPKTKILGHKHTVEFTEKSYDDRKDILFVGAIASESKDNPNYDSIMYFIKNIWHKVSNNLKFNLLVVGYNKSPKLQQLNNNNNIRVIGSVDKLDAYYNNCRLFIAPTRFAAGIPHKVTNAAAYGLPSVLSPLLAKQLGWLNNRECLVGEDDDDFVDKICAMYTNKNIWLNIRENMKTYLKNKCSTEIFHACLQEILS